MINDAQQQFSDSQAVSGAGATVSTNVIDLKQASDLFNGKELTVFINVEVAADTGDGDETYQFELEMDTAEGFPSATQVISRTIARATLVLGFRFTLAVPQELAIEQFLRVNYTLGGTTPSITVSAYLAPQAFVTNQRDYASGFTIS